MIQQYTLDLLAVICTVFLPTQPNASISVCSNNVDPALYASVVQVTDDAEFVFKAFEGGMTEMKAAEVAVKNAANPDIKAFAEKMMTDHSKANSELSRIAKQKRFTIPEKLSSESESKMADLQKKTSAEFDKAYVMLMVADHEKTVALFETQADKGKDNELKNWATQKLTVLRHHLSMAEDLSRKAQK